MGVNSLPKTVTRQRRGCDLNSGSSQAWNEQWKWRWWRLLWYQGMDGCSEADEYGNSKIWRQMRSGQQSEVFIKYEAEVSSRVSGGERGVVDFGKLFTNVVANEQKIQFWRSLL